MATFRVNKTSDYTIISNYHLKERKMSLKAKGLLTLMLSLPENWDYSISGLSAICAESEKAIKTGLDELKEFGYLKVTKILPNKEKGIKTIEYNYEVFEKPFIEEKKEEKNLKIRKKDEQNRTNKNFNQAPHYVGVDNQGVDEVALPNQAVENIRQLNTNISNTKELNTNILSTNNIYSATIDYLNKKANKNFKSDSKEHRKYIKARLNEKYTLEDFMKVIDNMCMAWIGTEWENYLRPSTLFGTKFENYLNWKYKKIIKKISKNETENKFTGVTNESIKKLLGGLVE